MSDKPKTTAEETFRAAQIDLAAKLVPDVEKRLGPERLDALAKQPLCLAAGGIAAVLQAACKESIGAPQPLISATILTLQLCGSKPGKDDLN